MTLGAALLIVLALALLGVFPNWPHSKGRTAAGSRCSPHPVTTIH